MSYIRFMLVQSGVRTSEVALLYLAHAHTKRYCMRKIEKMKYLIFFVERLTSEIMFMRILIGHRCIQFIRLQLIIRVRGNILMSIPLWEIFVASRFVRMVNLFENCFNRLDSSTNFSY